MSPPIAEYFIPLAFLPARVNHSFPLSQLSDFKDLEALTAGGKKHIAVVGGGFLGSDLACSLAHRGLSSYWIQS